MFQDRTPLGREIVSKTNAEAIIREARESLDRLDANIQLAQKLRFEDRQRAMEDIRSHLADIRAQLTPGPGTTAADLMPQQTALNQALSRREALEKQVSDHIVRIQELTRNGVHRFLTENPVITGVGGALSTTFGGIFSTLRDVGTIIGPTIESMWRPVESAGSTVLNFLAGAVGRLNPQIGEQLRARAQLVLQQEQLLKAFSSASNRLTGRPIAPVTEQEDRNAQVELSQIQQRSGRDVQSFASLALGQLSRLPPGAATFPGTTVRVPAPGTPLTMRILVQLAEMAFPVSGAPAVAPIVAPPPDIPVNTLTLAGGSTIEQFVGGTVRISMGNGTAATTVTVGGTAVNIGPTGVTIGATGITVTRPDMHNLTLQVAATASTAGTTSIVIGAPVTKTYQLQPRPR